MNTPRSIAPGIIALLLLGFTLRVHALDRVPPGWRDDEVIETTVHAQRVIDGERPIFFVEASGHEPLYHYASAGAIMLWGAGLFQVRLVSVFFGVLTLAAHSRLARRLFGDRVALISTLLLAASFWALMYSRVKIRHISALPFALLAFEAFLRRTGDRRQTPRSTPPAPRPFLYPPSSALAASIYLSLSLYTYFAARTAPVVLAVFVAYLAGFHRALFGGRWRRFVLVFAIAALLTLPLIWAIRSEPQAEARLSEVGKPLAALMNGDLRPALDGAVATLGMFGWTGDPEALYNIPYRPVLNWPGAVLFVAGLIVCARRWRDRRYAFLPIWLCVGLAPAFVSIPAGSLGHTILAQPAVYLAVGLGIETVISHRSSVISFLKRSPITGRQSPVTGHWLLLTAALIIIVGRDLRDYFFVWPHEPLVRHLYRADLREAALTLRRSPIANLALSGRLSLWDARALSLDAPGLNARWFNPETAALFPAEEDARLITFSDPPLSDWARAAMESGFSPMASSGSFVVWRPSGARRLLPASPRAKWANGLELVEAVYSERSVPGGMIEVEIYWRVGRDYAPPAPAIGASPDPPPQPFTSFVHVLAREDAWIAGYDRFDADAFSLRPGDVIIQRYLPALSVATPPGEYTLEVGWYDPVSGERIPTVARDNSYPLGAIEVEP